MELIQQINLGEKDQRPINHFAAPPCIARYSPVFWEPLPGTGERIVALVALEPQDGATTLVSAGTHCVLSSERLRSMLGKQRGNAAFGVLRHVAEFMTQRQQAGLPLSELNAPFHGFTLGPSLIGRAYSTEQLLDAAVRSVSAFGAAEDLYEDSESTERPRHTVKTSEFLVSLKRQVAGDDPSIKARFEKSLRPAQDLPELTVDYAYRRWMLQVTSLPATKRQSMNTLRESQSKLYEIDMIRRRMQGNDVRPVLMINSDILVSNAGEPAIFEALQMRDRLGLLAKAEGLELIESSSTYEAAEYVLALA